MHIYSLATNISCTSIVLVQVDDCNEEEIVSCYCSSVLLSSLVAIETKAVTSDPPAQPPLGAI